MCFSYTVIQKTIKADNGFRHINKAFQQFCSQWTTELKIGIPYNSQGHGIV